MPLLRKRPSNIKYSEKEHDKAVAKAAIKWHLKGGSSKRCDSHNEPTTSSESDKNKDGNVKKSVNLSMAVNTRHVPEVVFSSDGRKFFPCHFCCRAFAFKKRQVTHMDICLFKDDKRNIAKLQQVAAAVAKPDLEGAGQEDENEENDFEYDVDEEEFPSSLTENDAKVNSAESRPKKKLTLLRFKSKDDMNCSDKSSEGESPTISEHFIVQTYSEDELDESDQTIENKTDKCDKAQSSSSSNNNKTTEVSGESTKNEEKELNKHTTKGISKKPLKLHIPQKLEKSNKVIHRIRQLNRPSNIPPYFFQSIQLRHSRKVTQDKTKTKVKRLTRGALRRIKNQAKINYDKLKKKQSNKRVQVDRLSRSSTTVASIKPEELVNDKLHKEVMASNLESSTIQKVTSSLDTLSLNAPLEETQTDSKDYKDVGILHSDNKDSVLLADENKEQSHKEIEKEFASKSIKNFENILTQTEDNLKDSLPSTSGLQKTLKVVEDKPFINLRSKSNNNVDRVSPKQVQPHTSVVRLTRGHKNNIVYKKDNKKTANAENVSPVALSTRAKTGPTKDTPNLSIIKRQKLKRIKSNSNHLKFKKALNMSKKKRTQRMLFQEKLPNVKKEKKTVKRVSFGESTIINENIEKQATPGRCWKVVKRNSSASSSGLGVLKSRRLRNQKKMEIKTIPKQLRNPKLTVKAKLRASAAISRKLREKAVTRKSKYLKTRSVKSRNISYLPKNVAGNVQSFTPGNSSHNTTSNRQETITNSAKPIHQVQKKIKPKPPTRPIIIIKTANQINRLPKEEVDRLFNSLKENNDINNAGSSSEPQSLPSTSRDTRSFNMQKNKKVLTVQTDQIASTSSLNLQNEETATEEDNSIESPQPQSESQTPKITASGILERHRREMMENEKAKQNKPPVNASVYDFDETEDEVLDLQQTSKKRKYKKRSIRKDGSPVRKRQRRLKDNGSRVVPNLKELEQDIAEVSITAKAVNFPLLEFSSVMQPKVCPFPYCNELFKTEEEFIEHKIVKHQIGRILLGPDKLIKYDEVYQNSDKKKCPICFREISVTMNWKRHLKTHSKERDFSCAVCKKTFSRVDHMKNHEKRHLATIKQAYGINETENLNNNPEP